MLPSPAHQFLTRFINRPDAHAQQWAAPTRHGYKAVYEPISDQLFEDHLLGITTLGVYTTSAENTCRWLCIDVDSEQEEGVITVRTWLDSHGISSLRESRRFGRSGHIWVFFDAPVPSTITFNLACYLRYISELTADIFPKQASRPDSSSPGNLVRLPLGMNQKRDAQNWGLFDDCSSQAVDQQLFWFLEQPLNLSDNILHISNKIPPPVEKPSKRSKSLQTINLLAEFPIDWGMRSLPSGEITTGCPCCIEYGFDKTQDNLSIKADGSALFCHGGCSFVDIMQSLRKVKI
jgi:hypothetical protein